MYKSLAIAALISGASAFAPVQFGARTSTAVFFEFGEYDGKMWDNEAKKDVYAKWDPSTPRSTRNFNPFETFGGNTPDASGIYPGEMRYKDPIRPDVNFSIMMAERAEAEERAANPKPGDVAGAPGRKGAEGGAAPQGAVMAPAPAAPAPAAYAPPPAAPAAPAAPAYTPPAPAAPGNPMGGYVPGGFAPAAPAAAAPAAYTPPAPAAPAAPAAGQPGWVDPNPAPMSDAQALEMGWSMGGQAHTKDPTPVVDSDPRKTIPQGESFEEYMKSRGM
ncbi:hypothetical protein CTEN210_17816 [Chaetoceros tenuissimus]|uniref:PS II complex 12 kDa extrinsic protein n=1 Tax=Chaetoceros tenuissimus TaxID=426638 RepID=A0AAD3HF45_9STRA|nr:hypothetical protein CTEN210_17816 [Chaetoceros tenuissimus]